MSSGEACWRIFQFAIHYSTWAVKKLHVHMEGERLVTYNVHAAIAAMLRDPRLSTLEQWFVLNLSRWRHLSEQLTYCEAWLRFVSYRGVLQPRQREHNTITRMVEVSMREKEPERFYLRTLLHIVKVSLRIVAFIY